MGVYYAFKFFLMKVTGVFCLILLLFHADAYSQYIGQLIKIQENRYQLIVNKIPLSDSVIIKKSLNYPVFKFQQVDIDNNGKIEFVLGVVKRTIFDSTMCKRINIWKIENGDIVPMWLGSKMSHPLYDFETGKDSAGCVVYTIECEKNGLYLVAQYHWQSFGLKFLKYIKREIDLNESYHILNNEL
jgi:hypothetical protein